MSVGIKLKHIIEKQHEGAMFILTGQKVLKLNHKIMVSATIKYLFQQ